MYFAQFYWSWKHILWLMAYNLAPHLPELLPVRSITVLRATEKLSVLSFFKRAASALTSLAAVIVYNSKRLLFLVFFLGLAQQSASLLPYTSRLFIKEEQWILCAIRWNFRANCWGALPGLGEDDEDVGVRIFLIWPLCKVVWQRKHKCFWCF